MEIVCINSAQDQYQLINAFGEVLISGTKDECLNCLCDLTYYEEQMAYQRHLHLGTF